MVERLTDEIEAGARGYLEKIDGMGGAVAAIEEGWMKGEIEEAAYRIARSIEEGERVIVGVNRFTQPEEPVDLPKLDPELQRRQLQRLERVRADRDNEAVGSALAALGAAARGSDNLLYPMREALGAYATLGEVSNVLRAEFGEYEPVNF